MKSLIRPKLNFRNNFLAKYSDICKCIVHMHLASAIYQNEVASYSGRPCMHGQLIRDFFMLPMSFQKRAHKIIIALHAVFM